MKNFICFVVSIIFLCSIAEAGMGVHDGSVGDCDYCHRMHGGNLFLLKGTDQGSTCLLCHASYQIGPFFTLMATNGPLTLQMTPGGDFGWLNLDFDWPDGAPSPYIISSRSENHGHSIVAADYGYFQDSKKQVAPGGTYPSSQLSCVSCHDPHNRSRRIDNAGSKALEGSPISGSGSAGQSGTVYAPVGVYRLLADSGYTSYAGSYFVYPSPDAVAFGDDLHVAYGRGMSEWCSNCHTRFLEGFYISGIGGHMHPAGKTALLTPSIIKNYNTDTRYGNVMTGYSPLAPVEQGTSDYDTQRLHAADGGNLYRIDTSANVMCLTCHRAHASAWNSAIRWPYGHITTVNDSFLTDASRERRLNDSTGRYDGFRGVLCNKCHGKEN